MPYIVKTFKITGRCVKTVCSLNKEWRAVYQCFGSSLAARLMVVYFKLLWIFSPSKFRIGKCHNFSGNLFVMHVERLKEVFHCHYFFFLFLLLTQKTWGKKGTTPCIPVLKESSAIYLGQVDFLVNKL